MRLLAALLAGAMSAWAQRSLPPTDAAWAPKPAKPPAYTAPHRPHVKLAEVRARHTGQSRWREPVVDDAYLRSAYVQSVPGEKVGPRFHPETRIWWVVLDGELRFTIEGVEPFVARKGSMVQVPLQTLYSIETIGARPALRFETEVTGARTLYPREDAAAAPPPQLPGFDWVPVKLGRRKGLWGEGNRPHVSFEEMMTGRTRLGGAAVRQRRSRGVQLHLGLGKEPGAVEPERHGTLSSGVPGVLADHGRADALCDRGPRRDHRVRRRRGVRASVHVSCSEVSRTGAGRAAIDEWLPVHFSSLLSPFQGCPQMANASAGVSRAVGLPGRCSDTPGQTWHPSNQRAGCNRPRSYFNPPNSRGGTADPPR